jgi:cytochrome b561
MPTPRPLRNGDHGYGLVTKTLHWVTVLAFAVQFVVGYTMETEPDVATVACDPPGESRSGGDTSDAEDERVDRAEDACEERQDRREDAAEEDYGLFDGSFDAVEVHVLLGLLIIALGAARVLWRRFTPLPPWDPRLTRRDQRLVHATETVLLTLMFVVPATGIALVLGSDDLLALHVAAHVAFFLALGAHLATVLGKRLVGRML